MPQWMPEDRTRFDDLCRRAEQQSREAALSAAPAPPPPPPKGERPNGSFTQWSVTVHQSQVIIVVSLLLLSFGQLKSFSERMFL